MYFRHDEFHRIENIGWLRAAVLGANDGIISTTSLLMGIAAAHATHGYLLIAGIAALMAGALSMAAGEYISVSSQTDIEKADIKREELELKTDWPAEVEELTSIYVKRGLERSLAAKVAEQLMAHNALEAHMRDELGLAQALRARPLQAALFSAASFSIGAILPLIVAMITPINYFAPTVFWMAILFLALLGGVAAKIGSSKIMIGMLRVTFWGALAMLATQFIGSLFVYIHF